MSLQSKMVYNLHIVAQDVNASKIDEYVTHPMVWWLWLFVGYGGSWGTAICGLRWLIKVYG